VDWSLAPYRPDGTRGHSKVALGDKAKMAKWQAEDKLRSHIASVTGQFAKPDDAPTFQWFWENRFLPTRTWGRGQETNLKCTFKLHVLPVIGHRKLRELEKFEIDVLVKKIAEAYSKTIVHQVRTYVKAAMEEAVDQACSIATRRERSSGLQRDPRAIGTCPSRRSQACLAAWGHVDRLISRMCIVLGLRPGELFAAKWTTSMQPAGGCGSTSRQPSGGSKRPKLPAPARGSGCRWRSRMN
jgi:integrase